MSTAPTLNIHPSSEGETIEGQTDVQRESPKEGPVPEDMDKSVESRVSSEAPGPASDRPVTPPKTAAE